MASSLLRGLGARPGEKAPLLGRGGLDVAVIWVEKAMSGSVSWVDDCSPGQLSAYRLKKGLKPVTTAVKWALLLLAVVEEPTYCLHRPDVCPGSKSGERLGLRSSGIKALPASVTNWIAMGLWVYLLLYQGLRYFALGKAHETPPARALGICLSLVGLTDCVFSTMNDGEGLPGTGAFRVSRLIRPLVFLLFTRALRDAAGRLLRAVPGFVDVLLSLLLCVCLFAWTGTVIFAGGAEGRKLGTWSAALGNLWILFTTSNNPDVWLPGYHLNKFSFLFFFAFLVISLYLLSNVLLAAVYDAYKEQLKTMIKTFYANRRECTERAFKLLADEGGSISQETWVDFFPRLCGRAGRAGPAMEHNKARALAVYKALDKDGEGGIDLFEFGAVLKVLNNPREYIPRAAPPSAKHKEDYPYWARVTHRLIKRGILVGGHAMKLDNFVDCVILLDVGLVVRQSVVLVHQAEASDAGVLRADGTLAFYALWALSLFYVAVLLAKVRVQGLEVYWYGEPLLNRFDFFNVLPCFALECAVRLTELQGRHAALWMMRCVVLLHILRALRLFKHVRPVRYIANFVVQLAPTYYRMGMLLFLLFYVYATIGEQWFGGKIYATNPKLQGMAFAASGYWDVSFNDFVSSMVTMFVIMVVNNWTVISDAYVAATGSRWAAGFFVSFFVIANLVVLNILMALILECSSTLMETDAGGDGEAQQLTYEETLRKVLLGGDADLDESPAKEDFAKRGSTALYGST